MAPKTGNQRFAVGAACPDTRDDKPRWKLVAYPSGRADFPTESNQTWTDKAEAEAACERVNAGDETGLTFGSYADD